MQIFTPSIGGSAVNNEPAKCSGHLPYPWGRLWKELEGGELDAGGGSRWSKTFRRGGGLKVISFS